ncbi:hypothetical protein HOLleu_13958 [Holothuria leucospilota]|uniref:Uncharacterized protein n=1 Tax=Holothuria leucospilota TaxID=206669 RepID=A0A9Q1C7V8_HOLLE|nr:hypothetical protein HOLleu_13958 [Holothuria leucospilota]
MGNSEGSHTWQVKGHFRSPEVKRSKPCKYDNSRRITVRDLTLDMWMIPTIFHAGRRLFKVTKAISPVIAAPLSVLYSRTEDLKWKTGPCNFLNQTTS